MELYPSICEQLLNDALDFGKKYVNITDVEIKITHNVAKSILINQDEIWIKIKKNNSRNPLFDITMGGRQWGGDLQTNWFVSVKWTKKHNT